MILRGMEVNLKIRTLKRDLFDGGEVVASILVSFFLWLREREREREVWFALGFDIDLGFSARMAGVEERVSGKVRSREEWESSSNAGGDQQELPGAGGGKEKVMVSPEAGGGKEKAVVKPFMDIDWDELNSFFIDGTESSDDEYYIAGHRYRKMTDDEYERYCQNIEESDGFDIDLYPMDIYPGPGLIIPTIVNDTCRRFTDFAIGRHNADKGKNLKLIEIIKWNIMVAGPFVYFITLKAEDPDAGGSVNTYQVEVVRQIPEENSYVSIFRVKGEQPAN